MHIRTHEYILSTERGVHRQGQNCKDSDWRCDDQCHPAQNPRAVKARTSLRPEPVRSHSAGLPERGPELKGYLPTKSECSKSRKEPPNDRLRPQPQRRFCGVTSGQITI